MSGSAYDMQVDRYDDSTLSKMQRQYWEAKQIFLKNVKKKEDECIVSADADLDAKLEVSHVLNIFFPSIFQLHNFCF